MTNVSIDLDDTKLRKKKKKSATSITVKVSDEEPQKTNKKEKSTKKRKLNKSKTESETPANVAIAKPDSNTDNEKAILPGTNNVLADEQKNSLISKEKKKKRKISKLETVDKASTDDGVEPKAKLSKVASKSESTEQSMPEKDKETPSMAAQEKQAATGSGVAKKAADGNKSEQAPSGKPEFKKRPKKKRRKVVLPNPDPGALDAMLLDKKESSQPENAGENPGSENESSDFEIKKERKTPKKNKKKKAINISEQFPDNKDLVKADDDENENKETATPDHPALQYLELWKNDISSWSFKKVRQYWLIKNMYDNTKISDRHFEILVLYLQGAKGLVVTKTVEEAEKFISEDSSAGKSSCKVDRMRKLIQNLV